MVEGHLLRLNWTKTNPKNSYNINQNNQIKSSLFTVRIKNSYKCKYLYIIIDICWKLRYRC